MKTFIETLLKVSFAIIFLGLAVAGFATAADLNVPADYPTIQAAVDAAHTNDTIQIAPGVYAGQVVISNKVLTLIGQPGTILRATTNLPPFPGYAGFSIPSIMGIRSSQVTVRGLTFEGERLAERFVGSGVGHLEGIFSRQSSGTVENCTFYGFRESTPEGAQGGDAIVFVNFDDGPTEVNFRVVGSTFADNYRGITVIGSPTHQSINVTLENNAIIGPGPLRNDSNIGIFIREGVSGRIAGNTISEFSYDATADGSPESYGILAANEANWPPEFGILQPLQIVRNTLRDNQQQIVLLKGDNSVVTNNLIQGTAPGFLPLGLAVSGTNVTIANNQFEDMPEGIRLLGDDPYYGTILGAAVNAQVTSNRFCNVTKRINVEPLANDTETGTLVCPFPPPTVAIAVLLSWPGEEFGWTLESATGLDGPWAASDATTFTQNGRHSIAVPTAGERQFFRLR